MATRKKPAKPSRKKPVSKKQATQTAGRKKLLAAQITRTKQRMAAFLARRPHRSFRRTRRRDYVRSLKLPGYTAFTANVLRHIWAHRRVFGSLLLVYVVMTIVMVGLASQETFVELAGAMDEARQNLVQDGVAASGTIGLLLLAGISGNFAAELGEVQQIFAVFLFLMIWLATVWLMRAHFAGGTPKLRDALYSSGAPIFAITLIVLLLLAQMIPAAIGVIAYSTAINTDLFSTGALAMVVAVGAFLLIVLSLYLVVSSFFALIVATLPGMYPWQALRTAGDLVTGRRLRILWRLAWMMLVICLVWIVIMVPVILFATWLQSAAPQLAWVPLAPMVLAVVSSASTIFASVYIYMLYRKVVEDDADPA